jgi:hypothetical protein
VSFLFLPRPIFDVEQENTLHAGGMLVRYDNHVLQGELLRRLNKCEQGMVDKMGSETAKATHKEGVFP